MKINFEVKCCDGGYYLDYSYTSFNFEGIASQGGGYFPKKYTSLLFAEYVIENVMKSLKRYAHFDVPYTVSYL